jgi:hypothetical protein
MNSTNQFYSYAIFISWIIVFFAILAIFYSYMENGIILPTLHQYNDKEHKFKWMKDEDGREEPISDLTYRDNIRLDEKIANLKDPTFIKEIQREHIEELKQQNGPPFPVLYYVEPFEDSGSLKHAVQDFVEKNTVDLSIFKSNDFLGYQSGANFKDKLTGLYDKLVELQKHDFAMIPK